MEASTSATQERWLPITDYPGYEVSDLGRIRRSAPAKTRRAGAILSTRGLRAGYPSVDLCRDGRKRTHLVHLLVAAAFLGPIPLGAEVNHKNGVKVDPRADNLEFSTRSKNQQHAYDTGLQDARGARNGRAKLSEADVLYIRRVATEQPVTASLVRELARIHGVTAGAVRSVIARRQWRHLDA